MNQTIKGGVLMLFVNSKSVACATSHELTINTETKETSSKDAGGAWETSEAGISSWEASSENIASTGTAGLTADDLIDLQLQRQPVTLVFGEKSGTGEMVPDTGWTPKADSGRTGQAFITSVKQNAPNGDIATFTVNFKGTGPLAKVTAS